MALDGALTRSGPISNVTNIQIIGLGEDRILEKMASLSGTILWRKHSRMVCGVDRVLTEANSR